MRRLFDRFTLLLLWAVLAVMLGRFFYLHAILGEPIGTHGSILP